MSEDDAIPDVATGINRAVVLKLPDFWPSNPTGWFRVVDAQSALHNITDDVTKYNHVLKALGNDTTAAVEGFLASLPEENKYDPLKQAQ